MFERARQAMESISQPIPNRGGAPAQHADNDELRGRCEVVERQRDALIRRQRQKEYLTALLVHDLKDPVTAVGLLAQTMLNRDMLSEQDARSVKRMCAEVQVLDRMILNLLDISISAAGGSLVVKRDQIDIRSLCAGVLAELDLRAQARNAKLDAVVFAQVLRADELLLRRIVANLVDNAIAHAPPGTTVTVVVTPRAGQVEIRVRDEGPGVPEERREKVFEPFITDDADLREGRGLGLAFCKLAAEAHGGRIWIEDAAPGACFCVTFPDDL
jgi:two-component system sensor histidine kinase/response regulator